MPTFEQAARADIATLGRCPAEILPLATAACSRLLGNIILHNRADAWDPVGGEGLDPALAEARARARVAWLEWWAFPKACLGLPPPGGHVRR